MINQTVLARLRRELSRSVRDIEQMSVYIQALAETDWIEFEQVDKDTRKASCSGCYRVIARGRMIPIADNEGNTRYYCIDCDQAVQAGFQCTCPECATVFTSHEYEYKQASGKPRLLCPQCRQKQIDKARFEYRVCVICKNERSIARWGYLALCYECKEKYSLDDRIIRREYQKVNAHILRAQGAGLLATLTLDQWFERLIDCHWTCQYCLTSPYEQLDHFVPITKQGGTTASNCIPSCKACNDRKGHNHPDKVTTISRDALNRVRVYLEQFQ